MYYLFGVVTSCAGVPQRQWGDAVSVDVLGSALELSERRQSDAGFLCAGMIHFKQHGFVRLDDQRAVAKYHGVSPETRTYESMNTLLCTGIECDFRDSVQHEVDDLA
ncbi:hypothetical protein FRC0393_00859 [Corynebacterium diphtheriae]|nr:hypothetical protein FRC0292_00724 [Corynebacterium diphtheriae]CAB0857362.1 hypothetical protein FRC0383_00858 [Corynebacterium diphtheriae]CAB0879613.1 hypothetical protein FRC0393_00859 [Corynebacterium diphtheriae]